MKELPFSLKPDHFKLLVFAIKIWIMIKRDEHFLEPCSGGAETWEQRRLQRRLLAGSAEQRPAAESGAELRSWGWAPIGWNCGDREGHMNMLSSCTDCELSIAGSKMKALSIIVITRTICQLLHLSVFCRWKLYIAVLLELHSWLNKKQLVWLDVGLSENSKSSFCHFIIVKFWFC